MAGVPPVRFKCAAFKVLGFLSGGIFDSYWSAPVIGSLELITRLLGVERKLLVRGRGPRVPFNLDSRTILLRR